MVHVFPHMVSSLNRGLNNNTDPGLFLMVIGIVGQLSHFLFSSANSLLSLFVLDAAEGGRR